MIILKICITTIILLLLAQCIERACVLKWYNLKQIIGYINQNLFTELSKIQIYNNGGPNEYCSSSQQCCRAALFSNGSASSFSSKLLEIFIFFRFIVNFHFMTQELTYGLRYEVCECQILLYYLKLKKRFPTVLSFWGTMGAGSGSRSSFGGSGSATLVVRQVN